MIIACRSVFFKQYPKKIKGSLLHSHPLHVHAGRSVMGRESVLKCQCGNQVHGSRHRVCMGEWSDAALPDHEQSFC